MFQWLKRLGAGGDHQHGKAGATETYQDFTIVAKVIAEGSQYRCAGEIHRGEKQVAFIRADLLPAKDQAEAQALRKGRQIIDEQGESLFDREYV